MSLYENTTNGEPQKASPTPLSEGPSNEVPIKSSLEYAHISKGVDYKGDFPIWSISDRLKPWFRRIFVATTVVVHLLVVWTSPEAYESVLKTAGTVTSVGMASAVTAYSNALTVEVSNETVNATFDKMQHMKDRLYEVFHRNAKREAQQELSEQVRADYRENPSEGNPPPFISDPPS